MIVNNLWIRPPVYAKTIPDSISDHLTNTGNNLEIQHRHTVYATIMSIFSICQSSYWTAQIDSSVGKNNLPKFDDDAIKKNSLRVIEG